MWSQAILETESELRWYNCQNQLMALGPLIFGLGSSKVIFPAIYLVIYDLEVRLLYLHSFSNALVVTSPKHEWRWQYSKFWCDVIYDAVLVDIASFHVIIHLSFWNEIEAIVHIPWISKFTKRFRFSATDDLSNRKLSVPERCPAPHRLWQYLFPRCSIKMAVSKSDLPFDDVTSPMTSRVCDAWFAKLDQLYTCDILLCGTSTS